MVEFTDNIEGCGREPTGPCTPKMCKIDNGYGDYCDDCMCATCTRSDCHKETFDTYTVLCFGCARACKVEFLEAEFKVPVDCWFGEKEAAWELP